MKPEDLFRTLHKQYNTVPYKIQGYEAFHHDVDEIAAEAEDKADFHRRLSLRRDQRIGEITRAWDNISPKLLYQSPVLDDDPKRVTAFLGFTSNLSLDGLMLFFFFDSLCPRPPASSPPPPPLQDNRLLGIAPVNVADEVAPDSGPFSRTKSPHLDTAPASPTGALLRGDLQAKLTGATLVDTRPSSRGCKDEDDEGSSRKEKNLNGTGRTSRPSSIAPPPCTESLPPTLTRDLGVGRKQRSRPSRPWTTARDPGSDARKSPRLGEQQQRPARVRKTYEKTRTSRRLAHQPAD